MASAKATAIFDGNDSALQGTIKRIGRSLGAMQKKFAAGAGALSAGALNIARKGVLTLGVASIAAAGALAVGVKNAYDLGGSLVDAAGKTGLAADQFLILSTAAKDAGIEDITGAVAKMQKSLVAATQSANGPAAKALRGLGLDAAMLKQQLPVAAMQLIGQRLAAIQNPAERAAAAMAIFGKSGTALLPMFKDGGALTGAAATLGKQALLLRENAERFDAVSDRLGHVGLKLQGFFVGVATAVLPYMEAVTAKLDTLDLANQGERFGAGIKVAVDFLAGAFGDPAAMFGAAVQFLKAGFLGAGNVLIAGVKAVVPALGALSSAIGGMFMGLTGIISGTLMRAFSAPIEFLTNAITFALERASAKFAEIKDQLTPGGSEEGNAFRAAGDAHLTRIAQEKLRLQKTGEVDEMGIPQTENAKKRLALIGKLTPRSPFASRSMGEIEADNKGLSGNLGEAAVEGGQARIRAELTKLGGALAAIAKDFEYKDVLGEGAKTAVAVRKFKQVAAQGAKMLAAAAVVPKAAGPRLEDFAAVNTQFRGFGGGALGASRGVSGGAYGVIRQGDAARAKAESAAEKKKHAEEKKKTAEGTNERIDETNDLLKDLLGEFA